MDADSEGVEGKYYVWKPEEIENVLSETDAKIFNQFYDITEEPELGRKFNSKYHNEEVLLSTLLKISRKRNFFLIREVKN